MKHERTETRIPVHLDGMAEFHAREGFRELQRIYGYSLAREIMTEIIKEEGNGKEG